MNISQLLTVKEIATILRLNPLTIYDFIHQRKLPAVKIGRYYRVSTSDLKHFLEKQKLR
jgi:excisionase family DNA binding protein